MVGVPTTSGRPNVGLTGGETLTSKGNSAPSIADSHGATGASMAAVP
jgi:hypothetical protein